MTQLGYSWPVPESRITKSSRRFHVCPSCAQPQDEPDVIVEQVPPEVEDRPRCYRCGIPLGFFSV